MMRQCCHMTVADALLLLLNLFVFVLSRWNFLLRGSGVCLDLFVDENTIWSVGRGKDLGSGLCKTTGADCALRNRWQLILVWNIGDGAMIEAADSPEMSSS